MCVGIFLPPLTLEVVDEHLFCTFELPPGPRHLLIFLRDPCLISFSNQFLQHFNAFVIVLPSNIPNFLLINQALSGGSDHI